MDPDFSPLHPTLNSYIGGHRSALPTPSLCISLPIVKQNIKTFHEAVDKLGVSFRAHVKTHKTVEATRLQLAGRHSAVIVSTIREIRGLEPLVEEGVVTDILYGLPPAASYLPLLSKQSAAVTIRLLIDNVAHVDLLEANPPLTTAKWSVFIKIDMGDHRAGLPIGSQALHDLLTRVSQSSAIDVYGFYCHAGQSYDVTTIQEASGFLHEEVDAAMKAVSLFRSVVKENSVSSTSTSASMSEAKGEAAANGPLVLSVGATPTAHALKTLKMPKLEENITVEIHAGNFPFNDLQQLSTGVVPDPTPPLTSSLALTINAEIISVYGDRNEALMNVGTLGLGREPGKIAGWARVCGREEWIVGRISQEHGILTTEKGGTKVEESWRVGDRVMLDVQHACIAAAGYDWFYVVDEEDVVREIWYPWRGWL